MPINVQQTYAFKERMRVGREIADQLDPVMTVEEVAERTGLSKVMVRRIECLALYKLSVRMKQSTKS
jgi:DNA-directed RNA polymerase sigma subunit (sigma70/sigma32)